MDPTTALTRSIPSKDFAECDDIVFAGFGFALEETVLLEEALYAGGSTALDARYPEANKVLAQLGHQATALTISRAGHGNNKTTGRSVPIVHIVNPAESCLRANKERRTKMLQRNNTQ